MNFYHGTDDISGTNIQNQTASILPTLGGGELGQGFYVGDNLTLAISWAKGRHRRPAVLEFPVNSSGYAHLSFKQLNHRAVLYTWRQLKRMATTNTHTFGVDVVFGPFATVSFAAQYKFETASAVALLNLSPIHSPHINRIL